MKSKILLIAVVVFGLASCTQKLCPTYAEVETPTEEVEKAEV